MGLKTYLVKIKKRAPQVKNLSSLRKVSPAEVEIPISKNTEKFLSYKNKKIFIKFKTLRYERKWHNIFYNLTE